MDRTIGVIMPAYNASATIGYAVKSVMDQSFAEWQLYLVSDDGTDYRPHVPDDPRIVHLATESPRSGAPIARNLALNSVKFRYAATLDADDRFHPHKLAQVADALSTHPIVTTAIDVVDDRFHHLRYVGAGPSRMLTPGEHKWVNVSMDTMLAWDRTAGDPRFDATLPNMADLDFLLRLYRTSDHSFHIGDALHDYVKIKSSMSNKPGMTDGMIRSKQTIRQRLRDGYYGSFDPSGVIGFLNVSLAAEAAYPAALAANPALLFEDHIEPMLRATSAAKGIDG